MLLNTMRTIGPKKKKIHTAAQATAMREEKNVLVNCEYTSVPLAGF